MMDLEEQQRLVDDLERRVARCEESVGLDPGEQMTLSKLGELKKEAAAGEYSSSLVMTVCRLHNKACGLSRGSLQELEDRYKQLKVWLENDQIEASKILMTLEAKRAYVLQHEELLRGAAADLRHLQELESFINPPELSELEIFRGKLKKLDENGDELAERAAALEAKILCLAQVYNTTVNMLASVVEEWHQLLAEMETSGKADLKK